MFIFLLVVSKTLFVYEYVTIIFGIMQDSNRTNCYKSSLRELGRESVEIW